MTKNSDMLNSHTWREIHSQPDIWTTLANDRIDEIQAIRDWVALRNPKYVIFAGAGTSAYVGQILVAELGPKFKALATTDIVACPQNFVKHYKDALVVQFGRSGNSSESVGVVDFIDANANNCDRLHITTNAESALATREPMGNGEQRVFITPEGTHDQAFAMTSSFSSMYLTALAIFGELSVSDWAANVQHISNEARTLLPQITKKIQPRPERAVFIGSGALEFVAREMGLKVLELTAGQTMTTWDSILGFRHGPKSAVDDKTQIYVLQHPHTHSRQYDDDLIAEMRNQFSNNSVTSIGANGNISFASSGQVSFDAMLHVLVGQLCATYWSAELDLNIDDPFIGSGNLSRVVSHVQLYAYNAG